MPVPEGALDADRLRGDRGDTMLMATVFISFLLIASWALISGAQQWGARRDVQAAASAAARAGAQLSPEEVRGGPGGSELDPGLAAQRANLVLAASGYSGTVTVSGLDVIVVATGGVSYAFPAPGFPTSLTATATSNAVQGINEAGG